MCSISLIAGDNFPSWEHAGLFKQDLRRSTLVTNLPNILEADHFFGLQLSGSQIYSNSGTYQRMPGVRLSIYPNPGYNIWMQFARWPGSDPNFSVGTGLQVEFSGSDLDRRKAIGISWNSIFDEGYVQRDITAHGLYSMVTNSLNFGLMVLIDMHHLIVENGNGIPDYDRTILLGSPYISWLATPELRLSLLIPYNSTGPGVVINGEYMIGKRN